ncbi:MAG: PAS domain-containing sensor histidine kinase [Desulfosalsimonas sp.]
MTENSSREKLLQRLEELEAENLELKNQKEILEYENKQFRRLLENVHDVLYTLDRNATITYISPNVERIAGYSPEEVIGRNYREFVHPDEIHRAGENFPDILAGRQLTAEHRYIKKNGEYIWVMTTARPILENGQVTGVQGILVDITERKEKEDELRQREERYRFLVEESSDIIWTFDLSLGSFTYCSKSVERILGYSQEEIFGGRLDSVFSPDEKKRVITALAEAANDRRTPDRILLEAEHITKNGDSVWMEINAVLHRNSLGEPVSFTGTSRDVTERKKAEEALRRSENYYRAIFETSGAAIIIIDEDGKLVLANSRIRELTGCPREEIENRRFWTKFVHPEDLKVMRKYHYLRRQDPDAAPRQYEFRLIDREGRQRHIFYTIDMIPGTGQSVGSLIDITERRRAEEEKEKIQEQMLRSQMTETVGRMAGGVAHEFNNLFQILRGNLELLAMEKPDGDPEKARLNAMEKEINRGTGLISQLLLFSRRENTMPHKGMLFLNDHLKAIAGFLGQTILKRINIDLNLAPDIPPIYADPDQVAQVLVNMAANAADVMPESGSLAIETTQAELGKEDAAGMDISPGRYVLMSVTDTGPGIDENVLPYIFEPFFTTRETGRGTGMGLAAVYGIVRAHDGDITCRTRKGEGTAFCIYLPPAH